MTITLPPIFRAASIAHDLAHCNAHTATAIAHAIIQLTSQRAIQHPLLMLPAVDDDSPPGPLLRGHRCDSTEDTRPGRLNVRSTLTACDHTLTKLNVGLVWRLSGREMGGILRGLEGQR